MHRKTPKTYLTIAAASIGLLALSVPDYSQAAPRGAESQRAQSHGAVNKKKSAKRTKQTHSSRRAAPANRAHRLTSMPIAEPPKRPALGWPALVREARKYIGTNPTARKKLWCATFMNLVLAKVGYAGTNSDAAKSFAQYGRRISSPQVGAIAVLTRGKNGGHVGVVTGLDNQGNPIIVSGNHNKRVGEATYHRSRVIAYVMPIDEAPGNSRLAERGSSNRPASDSGLVSPITELLAAIESEQSRPERSNQQTAQQRPAETRSAAQLPPPEPQRTVQQLPEQASQASQVSRRGLPLDPALTDLFGIRERAQERSQIAPPRPAPQRQRQVQHSPSDRVAQADTGLGSIFGLR